jgi:hypothetical protein
MVARFFCLLFPGEGQAEACPVFLCIEVHKPL